MQRFFIVLAAFTSLVACGPGVDNVSACNKWKSTAACGTAGAAALSSVDCGAYANTTCDISQYFNCLSTAYVCVNGQYDPAKLTNATTCASQAVCR